MSLATEMVTNELERLDLSKYLHRRDSGADFATIGLVDRFRAVLGHHISSIDPGYAPLGFHWTLTTPLVPEDSLGPDGHIANGSFLPYFGSVRRMWGGGEIEFHTNIRPGDWVERESSIASIEYKAAKSGPLLILQVKHEYFANDDLAISERQDIVYRLPSPTQGKGQVSPAAAPDLQPSLTWAVDATTPLLFRYSAVTFNCHRIHYDVDYARQVEGYPGLVVHGPLQATLLLNLASEFGGEHPHKFTYRGVAPLFCGGKFQVCAASRDDRTVTCWTRSLDGSPGMIAEATWR